MTQVNKLYLVEDIAEFCDYYHIFDNIEQAQKYIQDHIKYGLLDCNRDIKIIVLAYKIDIQILKYEIPWDYIENNYNLTKRFLKEFEEYF